MTTITVDLRRPSEDGTYVSAGITLECTPTKRFDMDDFVVLPLPFRTRVVEDTTITLQATDDTWCWKINERESGRSSLRYVIVPESAEPVSYTDLVEVDPATLEPGTEPEAAWNLALDVVAEEVVDHETRIVDLEQAQASGGITKEQGDTYYAPIAFVSSTNSAISQKANTTDVDTGLAGKAAVLHSHQQTEVVGLVNALAGKADGATTTAALAGKADAAATSAALGTKANSADVTTALAGKSNTGHQHTTSDTTGLDAALATKATTSQFTALEGRVTTLETGGTGGGGTVEGITKAQGDTYYAPLAFVGSTNTALSGKANTSDLTDGLAGKAPLTHSHGLTEVTGLSAALAGKAPLAHTHAISETTGLQAALDNAATDADLAATNLIVTALQGNYTTLAGNMDSLFGRVNGHDTDIGNINTALNTKTSKTYVDTADSALAVRATALEAKVPNQVIASLAEPAGPHTVGDIWIDRSVVL